MGVGWPWKKQDALSARRRGYLATKYGEDECFPEIATESNPFSQSDFGHDEWNIGRDIAMAEIDGDWDDFFSWEVGMSLPPCVGPECLPAGEHQPQGRDDGSDL